MKHVKNLVAVTGTYTNAQGEEKKQYQTIGKLFKREDDSITIKIDSMPVGGEWSGWLNLYDPKPKEETNPGQQVVNNVEQPPKKEKTKEVEDDLPF